MRESYVCSNCNTLIEPMRSNLHPSGEELRCDCATWVPFLNEYGARTLGGIQQIDTGESIPDRGLLFPHDHQSRFA